MKKYPKPKPVVPLSDKEIAELEALIDVAAPKPKKKRRRAIPADEPPMIPDFRSGGIVKAARSANALLRSRETNYSIPVTITSISRGAGGAMDEDISITASTVLMYADEIGDVFNRGETVGFEMAQRDSIVTGEAMISDFTVNGGMDRGQIDMTLRRIGTFTINSIPT